MISLRIKLVLLIFVACWVNNSYGLTGWESSDAVNISIVNTSGEVQSGSKAIKLDGETGQQLNQEITGLIASGNYLLTGYVYIDKLNIKGNGGDDAGVNIVVSDNKFDTELASTVLKSENGDWEKFSLNVIAPVSGSVWVRCFLDDIANATVYIDNLWFGEAEVESVSSSGPGIVVENKFSWNGSGSVIDSYDSTVGTYNALSASSDVLFLFNSKSKQSFRMSSGLKMQGDLQIHPDGDVDNVVVLWGGSEITGETTNQEKLYDMSKASLPTGDPFNDNKPASLALSGSKTETIDSDRYFNKLQLWSGTKLYISGDVTIVVKRNFDVAGNAAIELMPNSSLKLYLKSTASIGGNMNANTADPSKMSIYMVGNNKFFRMYGSAKYYGLLDNPSGKFEIWTNSELFGAAKCKELSGGGKIHVDLSNTFDGGTSSVISSLPVVSGGVIRP